MEIDGQEVSLSIHHVSRLLDVLYDMRLNTGCSDVQQGERELALISSASVMLQRISNALDPTAVTISPTDPERRPAGVVFSA